jgi:hypothetical protein
MWLFLKVVVVASAILLRTLFRFKVLLTRWHTTYSLNGLTVKETKHKGKNSTTTSWYIPLECRSLFKLSHETSWHRFFKWLGIAIEIQVGEKNFDDLVYVASDSSSFLYEVKSNPAARELIMKILQESGSTISSNGKYLSFTFNGDKSNHDALLALCTQLHGHLSKIETNWRVLFQDHFKGKILIVEAVIWAIAAYVWAGYLQWTIDRQDRYLDMMPLIKHGIGAGIVGSLLLFVATYYFVKGSAHSPKLFLELLCLCIVAMPLGGVLTLDDVNRELDRSPSSWVDTKITDHYTREHRGNKGRRWYSYHLALAPAENSNAYSIPTHIEINRDLYRRATRQGTLRMELALGYLGYAWFRSLTIL